MRIDVGEIGRPVIVESGDVVSVRPVLEVRSPDADHRGELNDVKVIGSELRNRAGVLTRTPAFPDEVTRLVADVNAAERRAL